MAVKGTKVTLAVGCCLTLAATVALADGGPYRWVDDDGVVHFGDSLPPDVRARDHGRIDPSGTVIEAIELPGSTAPEDVDEARLQSEQQRERDRALLQTFATERDIILTRDDRLAGVDTQISLLERRIRQREERLEAIERRIGNLAEGSDARAAAERQHAGLAARIEQDHQRLAADRERRDEIDRRFAEDLERFRELQAERD